MRLTKELLNELKKHKGQGLKAKDLLNIIKDCDFKHNLS